MNIQIKKSKKITISLIVMFFVTLFLLAVSGSIWGVLVPLLNQVATGNFTLTQEGQILQYSAYAVSGAAGLSLLVTVVLTFLKISNNKKYNQALGARRELVRPIQRPAPAVPNQTLRLAGPNTYNQTRPNVAPGQRPGPYGPQRTVGPAPQRPFGPAPQRPVGPAPQRPVGSGPRTVGSQAVRRPQGPAPYGPQRPTNPQGARYVGQSPNAARRPAPGITRR